MKTHCKTLDPADMEHLSAYVENLDVLRQGLPHRMDHPYRRWEYGITLSALETIGGCRTVLDVGSGGGLLPLLAALHGYEVTALDPDPRVHWSTLQANAHGTQVNVDQRDLFALSATAEEAQYDGVVAISVIEHVDAWEDFLGRLCTSANRAVILTTDWSPDGAVHSPDHLRTYDAKGMAAMAAIAKSCGFEPIGKLEYADHGQHVFGYNFASLALTRPI